MGKFCPECGQEIAAVLPTHIVAILDMSGSMAPQKNEVINSFNKFLEDQRKIEGEAWVSLILFDNIIENIYSRVSLDKAPALTKAVYEPRGMTALFDTVNAAINEHFTTDVYGKEKTIFVIITDGEENASKKIRTFAEMKRIISKTRELGAEFVFLAADEASFAQGGMMGIPVGNAFSYASVGYGGGTKTMSAGLGNYRNMAATNTTTFFVDATDTTVDATPVAPVGTSTSK